MVAACAITYQLLIGTLSSYLLGNSVLHFSLTIGVFMFAMGAGAYLTRFLHTQLFAWFIAIEIALGLVGGSSALLLYLAYTASETYYVMHFTVTFFIGLLVGMELPLVTRLLRDCQPLKDAVAHAFSVDYIGALLASVLFPLVALPYLGVMRTAVGTGLLNCAVAAFTLVMFRAHLAPQYQTLRLFAGITVLLLCALGAGSTRLTGLFEQLLYRDPIVHSQQTPYQKLVMTERGQDLRLYIDGNLQFSSVDEYRYHEALVHVPMQFTQPPATVLLLGAGDGLALREVLKYPFVRTVTLVDLDSAMTQLGQQHLKLLTLNAEALHDPRVHVINQDAWQFIRQTPHTYDLVIADFPDPNDFAVGKLYTREFYRMLRQRMTPNAMLVTQATSPYFARQAYWCIAQTLQEVFPMVSSYQVYVPSFGLWGFHLAGTSLAARHTTPLPGNTRFITADMIDTLFLFDADTARIAVEPNRLDNQQLVQYYNASWKQWNEP